ncbi:MAG: hypothetical protein WCD18_21030 [Thermosynechococcaceae cyanobacterium]
MKNQPLTLQQYPYEIAKLQREMVKLDTLIRSLKETVGYSLNDIDRRIAFDETLKNDSQRKAKRSQLLETDGDYISASIQLRENEVSRDNLAIDIELLRSTFSILKLQRREAIATMELHTSAAA